MAVVDAGLGRCLRLGALELELSGLAVGSQPGLIYLRRGDGDVPRHEAGPGDVSRLEAFDLEGFAEQKPQSDNSPPENTGRSIISQHQGTSPARATVPASGLH